MKNTIYISTKITLAGSSYGEVKSQAQNIFKIYTARTKRRPYIRSKYFGNSKIFLNYFWPHLWQKNWRDRTRRLKFLPAALDLIKNSRNIPNSGQNPNDKNEMLHRFEGKTKDGKLFIVQIKENKKNDQKYFISVFPGK